MNTTPGVMVDSHCHLADEAFALDLQAVVERAAACGVTGALCIVDVTEPGEVARADRLTAMWDAVRTTAGVHPHRAAAFGGRAHEAVDLVRARAGADPRLRAIGEIGLDYHYDFAPRDVQREVFAAQVAFALDAHLPIVVHTREADADTIDILTQVGRRQIEGVFHCFSGDRGLAARALDLGFHVSFSGIVTFPKADSVRDAAAVVPIERLLTETDCPYLAPVPHRGRRNEPAWVSDVVAALARVRGVRADEVAEATTENYRRLFRP